MQRLFAAVALATLVALPACNNDSTVGGDGAGIDADLARTIAAIKAIDNHAHPVRPTPAGEKPDDEFDALPVDHLEPQSDPLRQRPKAPIVAAAHKELYGTDKDAVVKAHAADYATFMLDKMGIDIMVSNRVAMGPGLPPARFLWVPFADALMYPLDNTPLIHTPDQKAFYPLEEKLLKRYYAESGVTGKPATLADYLDKVVRPTLERHKQAGALAEKYEMAYLRTLDIENPSRADADKAYAGHGDYKALQDYIFRFIATECGRLGMAVHIHVAHGGGGYFNVSWSNPLLLEPLLNDPSLRKTNFVMIHGGWPFTREITPLLTKPNAYVDFSEQTAFNAPHDVAEVLRAWLAYNPEKVLFATDAYPESAELGWEEAGMIAANTGREALARALTGMMRDGEIDRTRAVELATMVLRDNARKLYGLK
ncbi:MAG TPA: amidohydrolase family protein [Gemmatimonadaceae bacterium]|nr:amidohydrolase family protein [Gemmatimonadaceae bacterium]